MAEVEYHEGLRAIALWQPWASLLLSGRKMHETRHWPAPDWLIGQRVLIHAAKKFPWRTISKELHEICLDEFGCHYNYSLPQGEAIGTAVLSYCQPTDAPAFAALDAADVDDRECGNWTAGRFAWRFTDHFAFERGIPMIGRQKIFTAPPMRVKGSFSRDRLQPPEGREHG